MKTWVTLCGIAVGAGATVAAAQPIDDGMCGKARAALRMEAARPRGGEIPLETLQDTDVLHNDLDFEVFPATHVITGSNTMTVRSLIDGLTEFTFMLRSNYTITSATVNGTAVSVSPTGDYGRVAALDHVYNTGEEFDIRIDYTGTAVSRGFGSIEFTRQDGTGPYIVYSLSEPYFSATWWPCKDGDFGQPGDMADKATLEMSVTAPADMSVVSNGLKTAEVDLGDGRKTTTWNHDYPVATYLVAFCATQYNTWTADYAYDGGTMPVVFNVYPTSDTPGNRAAWERSVDMLDVFGRVYGPYPFITEKYGIYECEFGGGMEHQTNTAQGTFSEWVTAHEASHQWWGDMITCRRWHDIWLNEGFATYSEALWQERKSGSIDTAALHAWMANRRPSSVDDSVYVYDTSDMNRIFSGTYSYRKGGWVLHMLRHVVGDDTFFDILAAYRNAYEGSAATTDDFAAVCAMVHGQDLSWFFDEWVYGIGAPAYRYGYQSASINGRDYLKLHVQQMQDPGWGVFLMPLDVRVDLTGSSPTYTIWNDEQLEHFVVPIPGPATGAELDEFDWTLHIANDAVAYVQGPPVVVEAEPAPGAAVLDGLGQVRVTFSEDVACSAGDFAVTGDATGPAAFDFAYDAPTQTAILTLTQAPATDVYTVAVADAVSAFGQALDGEISDPDDAGSLPSGEGLPGGAAVYRFSYEAPCAPDLNGDGVVDSQDFIMFLNGFTSGDPLADWNGDGVIDSQDFIAFLNDFVRGC